MAGFVVQPNRRFIYINAKLARMLDGVRFIEWLTDQSAGEIALRPAEDGPNSRKIVSGSGKTMFLHDVVFIREMRMAPGLVPLERRDGEMFVFRSCWDGQGTDQSR